MPARRPLLAASAALVALLAYLSLLPVEAQTARKLLLMSGGAAKAPSWVLCSNGTTGNCPITQAATIQCNFATGLYWYNGAVQTSCPISNNNASTSNDLMPLAPSGFTYTSFGANVQRITPGYGLLVENQRQNVLLNSLTPATQTTGTLATGTYTLTAYQGSGIGASSLTMSAGTATGCGTGTATQGNPLTVTITVAGTCTVTVTGSTLVCEQLESGTYGSSCIPTGASPVTRFPDQVTGAMSIVNLMNAGQGTFYVATPNGTQSNTANTPYLLNVGTIGGGMYVAGANTGIRSLDINNANNMTAVLGNSTTINGPFQAALSWSASGRSLVGNQGTVLTNANTLMPTTTTSVGIGGRIGSGSQLGNYISQIAFFNSKVSDTALQLMTGGLTSGQQATLATLLSASSGAVGNNPVDNAPLNITPTQSSTHDSTFSTQANYYANPTSFYVMSGNWYARSSTGSLLVGSANLSPSTSTNLSSFTSMVPTIVPGDEMTYYKAGFVTGCQVVEIGYRTATNPYRLVVNNQFDNTLGTVVSAGSQDYVKYDFGSAATRTIWIEASAASSFDNVAVTPPCTITAATPTVIKAAATGDSITEGLSTGSSPVFTYAVWFQNWCEQNGITDCRDAAVGLTGYWNSASGARSNIAGQMPYWINNGYSIIWFSGGNNDCTQTTNANMSALALADWKTARAANPNALIAVLGIWGEALGPSANLIACENALYQQFISWGDPFSFFMRNSTAVGGSWLYGTGYVGATNGTGNSDTYVSSDGTHPAQQAGQLYMSGQVNAAYRAILPTLH